MSPTAKKWLKFALRWGIAVFGIWYVISNMSLRDRVRVLNSRNQPVMAALLTTAPPLDGKVVKEDPRENASTLLIIDPETGAQKEITHDQTVNKVSTKEVTITTPAGPKTVPLLGVKLEGQLGKNPVAARLIVADPANPNPKTAPGKLVAPEAVVGGFHYDFAYPRIDIGLKRMASSAKTSLLFIALAIFPLTFILTSYRWHELLKALEIQISLGRAFVLNMVGCFYNSFMPGSTGGDVLKAYYTSKVTPHRTRAVMSVVVDRVIGLLALVILGGTMASTQWEVRECRNIALVSAGIIAAAVMGLLVFYQPTLHRLVGLDWIIRKLPWQKQVQHAVHVMMIYRRQPLLVGKALLVTFPVHMTVVASATLCGVAFGLPLDWQYYWAVVPVIVLVGSLPISPQGAGVMEYFAIKLTERQHATVSQAFALTMSIRVVQILWNLTGGFFVLRGGFHAPTAAEQHEVEDAEDADEAGDAGLAPSGGGPAPAGPILPPLPGS